MDSFFGVPERAFPYYSCKRWSCTAHETVEAEYPVHELIFLLRGSITLAVAGEEHVFEAGDAFFIPQGLKYACRPRALRPR